MTDRRNPVLLAAAGVIIAAMAILVPFAVENTYATFWALVPPVVAIGLALITKEVFSSLFVGIVVGGMFANSYVTIMPGINMGRSLTFGYRLGKFLAQ